MRKPATAKTKAAKGRLHAELLYKQILALQVHDLLKENIAISGKKVKSEELVHPGFANPGRQAESVVLLFAKNLVKLCGNNALSALEIIDEMILVEEFKAYKGIITC